MRWFPLAFALVAWATPAAAQDPQAGQRVFAQCRACHQVGETARSLIGPHLNGIVGRKAGAVEGYEYSAANKDLGIAWTEDALAAYLRDPAGRMPGSKMVFAGIKNDAQIADLIAYLKRFGADGKAP
jgi:cytochrome c